MLIFMAFDALLVALIGLWGPSRVSGLLTLDVLEDLFKAPNELLLHLCFFEHKSNRPEIVLHIEGLAADQEDNDTALCQIDTFRLCLQDGLADLLQEGHSARVVEPRLGLLLEDLVHPRTCGRLQVQEKRSAFSREPVSERVQISSTSPLHCTRGTTWPCNDHCCFKAQSAMWMLKGLGAEGT